MGDVSFDPPLINDEPMPLPAGTTAKASDFGVSAGWTNERHSTYISSMEAIFLDQLFGGLRKHAAGPADAKADCGDHHELKVTVVHQEDLVRNNNKNVVGFAGPKNSARPPHEHDDDGGGCACAHQPAVHTWVRRFRPHGNNAAAAVSRRGEASVDDYGSGTDSVQRKVQTYGREARACAQGNFTSKSREVSDQNFSEEDVEADDEPCKRRRRPTSASSAEPDDQTT